MTTIYKIRKKDDIEMFVKGTPTYMSYDTVGRIFQTIGKLRSFLTGVMNNDFRYNTYGGANNNRNRLSEWEVVEIEMVVKDVKGVHEVISQKKLIELLTK